MSYEPLPPPPGFLRAVRNGILLSIPLWGVIIFGIKELFSHG